MNICCTPHVVSTEGLIDFQFCIFTVKSPSVTQRSVSQENAFKKSKNLLAFVHKTIGSNKSFTLDENNFRFFKIAKFEFKVTVHHSLWANCINVLVRFMRGSGAYTCRVSIRSFHHGHNKARVFQCERYPRKIIIG